MQALVESSRKGGGMEASRYLPADDPHVHIRSMYIAGGFARDRGHGIKDCKNRNHVPWDLNG